MLAQNMEKPEFVLFSNIPRSFLDEIGRELGAYSVAIGYSKIGNAKSFKPIGSGVLVQKGKHFGILTAHHCLYAPGPDLQLGTVGGDVLHLILTNGQGAIIPSEVVTKHPLAIPDPNTHEPDLAFIEILSASTIGTIKAIASFKSLDKNPDDVQKEFGNEGTAFVVIGFPGVHYQTKIEGNTIRHTVKHMTYFFNIKPDSISYRNGWDYIEANCWYGAGSELPHTFGGVSGGPVWGLFGTKDAESGLFKLTKFGLLGIAFAETPIRNDERKIQAHFVKSIYDLAWRNLK